ncbi:MAG: DUF1549 and DUF1553 domain-containing protein, partial [Gemmataceae bacterium]
RALLRRVTLDLTGLPPTPAEQAAFLADGRPDAYERLVDRLLGSPAYGERVARRWMDAVHFAETHGHDQDRVREHAWPYRDYLIRAFNADTPYPRFAAEQLAADVLEPGGPLTPALGLLAAGPWDESSLRDIREDTLDRQVGRYLDRDDIVTTVMQTFTSTTAQCARCHDHKFDPISQKDYYALQAVFAGADRGNRPYSTGGRPPDNWKEAQARWRVLTPTAVTSSGGATLTPQPDGSFLSEGKCPDRDTVTFTAPLPAKRVTGLRLEVLADDRLPKRGPGRQANGNLHLSEVEVTVGTRVKLAGPTADHDQDGWTVAHAVDGNERTAWGVYPAVGQDHVAVFPLDRPAEGASVTVVLKQVHGQGHLLGRFRLSATDADPVPTATPAGRSPLVYAAGGDFIPDGSHRPAAKPRAVHLLKRGAITSPGKEAKPGAYSCVAVPFELEKADDEAARRMALAGWLTHRDNPLFWRSVANRVWGWYLGRGIVDTPNDFGAMGGKPTHPALLDALACEVRDGGSLKALTRLIVTSDAYRKAGRRRLDAEEARDAVLLAAGRLDRRMGGLSDREFAMRPSSHVTPVVDYAAFDADGPARRGVYRFLFRTLPDPLMSALDCPAGDQLTPARLNAVTVQQALALWNSPFIARHAAAFGRRLEAEPSGDRVRLACAWCWGREPTADEARQLEGHAARHGWAAVARVLFNSNEFLFAE